MWKNSKLLFRYFSLGIYPNTLEEKYSNKCAKLNNKTIKAISKCYGIPFQMLDNFIDNNELNYINEVVSKPFQINLST